MKLKNLLAIVAIAVVFALPMAVPQPVNAGPVISTSSVVVGEVRNPTWVGYFDFGVKFVAWNWDKLPAGRWEVEISKDLINWERTGVVTDRNGQGCYTSLHLPEEGFARVVCLAVTTK